MGAVETASEKQSRHSRGPVRTTCPYCGVGCGVLASVKGDGSVGIQGDEAHPANFGRLCVKGSALGETVSLEGRLLYPQLRDRSNRCDGGDGGEGRLQRSTWTQALDRVASGFSRIIAEHGPESVALYVSGQLLTEDYYVANKLVKGWWGTGNIDTNSRLCMSSAVAAHKRAFGADTVPVCYEDLEQADLIVLVGSNTAWCHPVIWQRIVAARKRRPALQLVVIDPRRTATCEQADLHLPIAPGTDVWLFNGLLAWLHAHGHFDADWLAQHTCGADEALAAARSSAGDPAAVARICGVDEAALRSFYGLWAATPRVITAFSMGVNQSSAGVDKGNAIINCHLATGRIGRSGAGPFSITGQPNAMGGREVGGLSNQLAAHLDLDDAAHRALVQRFWGSPVIADKPGLKAVDLFEAMHAGKVRAVWIMATNPVVSLPDADRVRAALERCELVVVSDVLPDTDTAQLADVLLPAAAWGEKDGTVTNSERRISRQRAFLPLPGEARPDWWALCEVARRMGAQEGFGFASAHEIFLEHARLSAFGNSDAGTRRDFDLSGLVDLSPRQYDQLAPVQWPLPSGAAHGVARLFGQGQFYTADRRARLLPLQPRQPVHATDAEFPLVLNTGRVRDQWHTMSRTGRAPTLATHTAEPFVEITAQDAQAHGIVDGALARVRTRWGQCVVRARITASVGGGQLFVPIHWNGATASDARVGALVNPVVDPLSGEPEFKHTPASIAPQETLWHGFLITRAAVQPHGEALWWTRIRQRGAMLQELAGWAPVEDWSRQARAWFGAPSPTGPAPQWLEAVDAASGMYRAARVVDGRLDAVLFVDASRAALPPRDWLASLFELDDLPPQERAALLRGLPSGPRVDPGPTVCSCFNVGRNTILRAVREQGFGTPEALGAALKCGTNCGSCVPELRQLIAIEKAAAR